MNLSVKPIPEGMHSLMPHLVCRDASAAMDFYVSVFGARDCGWLAGPDGRLMHGMMFIGDSALMRVDENPQWGMHSPLGLNGTPVIVHLYVKGVDATMARAVKAGEVVVFSWIVYRSRKDRDRVNAAVMADPRMAVMEKTDPKDWPFDGQRMFWGGFKPMVSLIR